jgi:hypothetical protein
LLLKLDVDVQTGALVLIEAKRLPSMARTKELYFQRPKREAFQELRYNSTNSVYAEQICTWLMVSMFLVLLGKSGSGGCLETP